MKIVLLGKNGQLGWELNRALATLGEVQAFDYPEIDLAQPEGACRSLRQSRPDLIVNATAYTAVDRAESEAELAMAVNGLAPGRLAETAQELKAALIHYSTDYVFDGTKGSPHTEADAPNPLNVYGKSKLAGERSVAQVNGAYLILRTSWVYSLRRDSFVTKALQWARKQETLHIVTDQISNPTWARMLAEITAQLVAKGGSNLYNWLAERKGIYHLAGNGCTSRFELVKFILEHDPQREGHRVREIQPALTSDFPTPARRPLYTCLDCTRFTDTFGLRLPDWKNALILAMNKDG